MTVTFTAPVTTPRGRKFYARWQTLAPHSTLPEGCSPSSSFNPIGHLARAGQRIVIHLTVERLLGDAFCPGPSQVLIFTQLSGPAGFVSDKASKATYRQFADYRFRVFRPV